MLKKTLVTVGLTLFVCLSAVNFSLATQQQPAKAFSWPAYFTVATPSVGTGNHSIASAWTSEFTANTGVKARVLPSPNGYARAEWLETKQVDLSLYQASDYIEQLDGIAGYASKTAGPADSRSIYLSLVTAWGYMVRGDSPIKTIKDIGPQTRVVWYRGASFIMTGIRTLLATQGLTPNDVKLVEVGSYGANSKVIAEGRADIAFTSPLSDLNYEVAANPKGIRWLAIPSKEEDPKAYRIIKTLQPGYSILRVKTGVKSGLGIRMLIAYQNYHVRGDEDEEFVYHLAKWLDENYNLYKDKYIHAKLMTIDNYLEFLENDPVEPIHPGAIRYLKEKGLWKDKFTRQNEFNLELSKKYIEGFRAAVKAAEENGIEVEPQNKKWVDSWKQYKENHGLATSYGVVERPE
jgi:TRAP transporter TAXI family solute receptor